MMRERHFLALGPHGFHRVAYAVWGQRSAARTVICVHGLTRNGRDFDALAEALSEEYRVICPDMPGRGRSEKLAHPPDYQYPVYLQTCASLIAHLDVDEVDWVGTSMGGLIGMMLAAQPNSPVKRLILNDVGALIPGAALERIASYVKDSGPYATLHDLEQRLRTIHASFGDLTGDQWRHLARHSQWQDPQGQLWLAYDPAIADSIVADSYPDIDLWPVWSQVHCPTLIVRGEQSDVLPESVADAMVKSHASACVNLIAGVGHAPALMADEQIQAIRSWLQGHGRR